MPAPGAALEVPMGCLCEHPRGDRRVRAVPPAAARGKQGIRAAQKHEVEGGARCRGGDVIDV